MFVESTTIESCSEGEISKVSEENTLMISEKKMNATESIFIFDARISSATRTRSYIYDFDQSMVPDRVWNALTSLKKLGLFYFNNVGDSSFMPLVDVIENMRAWDQDFVYFFNEAMEDKNIFGTDGDSMERIGKCSWMVNLEEEKNCEDDEDEE